MSVERLKLPTACQGLGLESPGSGNLGVGSLLILPGLPCPGLVLCLFLLVSRILATGLLFVIAEGFLVFGNKCLEPWPVSSVLRPWAFFDGYCLTPLVRPGLLQAGARLVTCVLHLVFSLIIRTGSYCHRPHLLMLQALVKSSQLASGKGGYGIQIF